MSTHDKIYWHEAFFEALQLELYQYKDSLEFHKEHRINEEALRMDVLVIKKEKDTKIEKNIGHIFKGHNIFEYKSETDSFSRWDYHKLLGYAHIYSSLGQVAMSDITISISLTMYPREMLNYLVGEYGVSVQDIGNGIYYVHGDIIPIQILESKRLSPDSNLFLRNLRSNLSAADIVQTMHIYGKQKPLNDKAVYLDRLTRANREAYEEARKMMSLMDIIQEAFDEGHFDELVHKGISKGQYDELVRVGMNMGVFDDMVIERLASGENLEYILEKAEKYGLLDERLDRSKKNAAREMLQDGTPIEKIAKWLQLPHETIEALQT